MSNYSTCLEIIYQHIHLPVRPLCEEVLSVHPEQEGEPAGVTLYRVLN